MWEKLNHHYNHKYIEIVLVMEACDNNCGGEDNDDNITDK